MAHLTRPGDKDEGQPSLPDDNSGLFGDAVVAACDDACEEDAEEDASEEENSDDELRQSTALPVDDVAPDFDLEGPPQTVEEYLRRVRWEAKQCPDVVRAHNIDQRNYDHKKTTYVPPTLQHTLAPPPPHAKPSERSIEAFENDFTSSQQVFSSGWRQRAPTAPAGTPSLPAARDLPAWRRFIGGKAVPPPPADEAPGTPQTPSEQLIYSTELPINDESSLQIRSCDPSSASEADQGPKSPGRPVGPPPPPPPAQPPAPAPPAPTPPPHPHNLPLLSTLSQLDEARVAALLRHLIQWIMESGELTHQYALWLFALSAVVDTPLHEDTSASLRALVRFCSSRRADQSLVGAAELGRLNIALAIAGKCFGQGEGI